jgi:hypothetical protein
LKGYVYLICDNANELYKIGVTKGDIQKRLKKLQTGNATELFIVNYHESNYPYRVENMLHNHFRSQNVLNEWFELSHEDVVNFRNICKIMEERIKCLENNPFFMKKIH